MSLSEFRGPAVASPLNVRKDSMCAEPSPWNAEPANSQHSQCEIIFWRIRGRRFDLDMDECFRAASGGLASPGTLDRPAGSPFPMAEGVPRGGELSMNAAAAPADILHRDLGIA